MSTQKNSRSGSKEPARTAARHPSAGTIPVPKVPRKWAWHHRTLLALLEQLQGQHRAALGEARQPLEAHSLSLADSGTDEFDHDLLLSQISAEQNALYDVVDALRRILDGTYGVCQETGEPIPAARLRAVPWTRFAKAAEIRAEKKGAVATRRLGRIGTTRAGPTVDLEGSDPDDVDIPTATDELQREVSAPRARAGGSRVTKPVPKGPPSVGAKGTRKGRGNKP